MLFRSRDAGKPGCDDGVGSEQDSEKYRRLAIMVGPKCESDAANFAGIKQLGSLRHSFFELRLVYDSSGHVHKAIIARPRRIWGILNTAAQ